MNAPTPSHPSAVPPAYLARVRDLLQGGGRKVLGLVGAPGAGKSTLAEALRQAFPGISQVVPMDGFHLADVELRRLGRSGRKGAPDTFDSAGYVALLAQGGWAGVAPLLDDVWYVDVDDTLRTDRLTRRHERFGRSRQDALAWVAGTDEPNARLVAATRDRARLVFDWRG